MNSCLADAARLWCANSNYSLTPMGSSVEVFDAATLDHVDSPTASVMTEEGSLTWFDRYRGRLGRRVRALRRQRRRALQGPSFSSVVTFDAEWRRTGGWLFPGSVLERMAPYAASGGADRSGRLALPPGPRPAGDVCRRLGRRWDRR